MQQRDGEASLHHTLDAWSGFLTALGAVHFTEHLSDLGLDLPPLVTLFYGIISREFKEWSKWCF